MSASSLVAFDALYARAISTLPSSRSMGHATRGLWNHSARPARSCRWISATPVVAERFSKRTPDLAAVASWCVHAGLPEPVSARVTRFRSSRAGSISHQ